MTNTNTKNTKNTKNQVNAIIDIIDIAKLLTSVSDIDKLLKSVNSDSSKLLNKTWILGASIAKHFLANRDTVSLNRWFGDIKDGVIRKKALGLWLKDGLSLEYTAKDGFIYNKDSYKPKEINWFLTTNPFTFSIEKVAGFDFSIALKAVITRAKAEMAKNPNSHILDTDIVALERIVAKQETLSMTLNAKVA